MPVFRANAFLFTSLEEGFVFEDLIDDDEQGQLPQNPDPNGGESPPEPDSAAIIFEGMRELRIEAEDPAFIMGSDLGQTEIIDTQTGQLVDIEATEPVRFLYPEGEGIFVEFIGPLIPDTPGVDIPEERNGSFAYRVLAEGDTFPEDLEPGQAIDSAFTELDIEEVGFDFNPDSPYATGQLIPWDALAGVEQSLTQDAVETIALLYDAALGREPDEEGLNYWVDQREQTLTERELAGFFLRADETEENFGADPQGIAAGEFVDVLYTEVLGREADAAGDEFWTNLLQTQAVSRSDILLEFADSAENREDADFLANLTQTEEGDWAFA